MTITRKGPEPVSPSVGSSSDPRLRVTPFRGPWCPRVLVVDNDATIGRVVDRVLGRDCELRVCTDSQEAYSLILAGTVHFDVILCDLLMPGLSGRAFYAAVLKANPVAAARIVFITGAADLPDSRAFFSSIPNLVLEKPFTRAALKDVVRAVASEVASSKG